MSSWRQRGVVIDTSAVRVHLKDIKANAGALRRLRVPLVLPAVVGAELLVQRALDLKARIEELAHGPTLEAPGEDPIAVLERAGFQFAPIDRAQADALASWFPGRYSRQSFGSAKLLAACRGAKLPYRRTVEAHWPRPEGPPEDAAVFRDLWAHRLWPGVEERARTFDWSAPGARKKARVSATSDWLVVACAVRGGHVVATTDKGPEFEHVDRIDFREVLAAATAGEAA